MMTRESNASELKMIFLSDEKRIGLVEQLVDRPANFIRFYFTEVGKIRRTKIYVRAIGVVV